MRYFIFLFMTFAAASSTLATGSNPECLKDKYGLSAQALYYMDNRDFNTFGLITSASKLPYHLSFWGFTDVDGNQTSPRDRRRLTHSLSEYRLNYNLEQISGIKGLGLEAEFNYFSASNKRVWRFGPAYKHPISFLTEGSWLRWRIHPFQSDENWQMSVSYYVPLSEKWSISGFADYNINTSQTDRWILEPQLNYQINKTLSVHLEYRYNGFEDANDNLRGNGLALGVGCKF